jgi:uncharacterized membrane protein
MEEISMSYGPIELVAISFPGNQFSGEIIPALQELIDNETIRIIDIVFAIKDEDGNVDVIEVDDLPEDQASAYAPTVSEVSGLLSADDVQRLAAALEPNSSAGLMLFENAWATKFVDAVANANGQVILNERIPRAIVEAAIAGSDEE